ncbi:MAG: type IV pilus secretin PilQ [Rhodoferax sp.]|nr:type IV pilus secretin PilQ [Rhodoferax sp.]
MRRRFVVFVSLAASAFLAQAQTAIEAVSGSMQGGVEQVRIDLSQALVQLPNGFSIQSPARIALDFPGVKNAMGRSSVEVNEGNLRSINVVQAGERTRVVLNLKKATSYRTEIQGKSLLVTLDSASARGIGSSTTGLFAEKQSSEGVVLKDVDFRRSADGAGRVVVTLPQNNVGVDIRQQGKALVVDFLKTSLAEGLRRKMDVTDFGTPVRSVSTTQVGDRVRMVIEPQGQWDHSAYQKDDQFVVEVKELKTDPKKLTQGVGYNGQKLSLNFQNIEVRSLLQVIADFTNFNIVTSDSVSGSVTLRLQDVPWDQALDIILQAKSLGMRRNGNVIWVAPKDEIAAKEKLDLESMTTVQNLEPVKTQSFQINFAKATEIATQIAGSGGAAPSLPSARILSTRGSVIAEPRTNQLFVTDIPGRLEQVQELIGKLDVAVRQVVIEARIVEASDTFSKALGVRLGGADIRAQRGGTGGYEVLNGNSVGFATSYGNALATSGASGTVDQNLSAVNLPVTGAAGVFALSIFNASANRFLNLEISALESDGKGKVISSPRVVTADQTKALIEQGTELPYQVASASGATSIQFRKANLKLEVTPQITPEGSIILNLDVNKDTVGQLTPGGYAIDTKHIQTQALVENGGTIVIGGIFTEDQTSAEDKVPFFGDLPLVGYLFKRSSRGSNKKEMLVFITPKVLGDRGISN